MPRATTSEIIDQGDYLDPEFDPSTLTIAQLLGVLQYHNVAFPIPQSKTKLVNTFNTSVKPQAAELSRLRQTELRKTPSYEGIIDGTTGDQFVPLEVRSFNTRSYTQH